jgi:predicted nucleic acid-binding Zn ribbon protein
LSTPPTPPRRQPRRVRDSLEQVVDRLGGAPLPALEAVFARWPEAVGPVIAAHSRPVSMSSGTLVVAVDEPGWATELRYLAAGVLERLKEVAGQPVAERLEVRVQRKLPGG